MEKSLLLNPGMVKENEDFNHLFNGVYDKISDNIVILIDGLAFKEVN